MLPHGGMYAGNIFEAIRREAKKEKPEISKRKLPH